MGDLLSTRLAHTRDAAFLFEMLLEALNHEPGRPRFAAGDVRADPQLLRYVDGWGRTGDLGMVAESGGRPIGAAWLRVFDPAQPGYGFIAADIPELSVSVLPEWRGRGVGGRLLADLQALAVARGCTAISLSVDPSNPARRLYRRLGFRDVGTSGTSITMRLDLASPRTLPAGRPVVR